MKHPHQKALFGAVLILFFSACSLPADISNIPDGNSEKEKVGIGGTHSAPSEESVSSPSPSPAEEPLHGAPTEKSLEEVFKTMPKGMVFFSFENSDDLETVLKKFISDQKTNLTSIGSLEGSNAESPEGMMGMSMIESSLLLANERVEQWENIRLFFSLPDEIEEEDAKALQEALNAKENEKVIELFTKMNICIGFDATASFPELSQVPFPEKSDIPPFATLTQEKSEGGEMHIAGSLFNCAEENEWLKTLTLPENENIVFWADSKTIEKNFAPVLTIIHEEAEKTLLPPNLKLIKEKVFLFIEDLQKVKVFEVVKSVQNGGVSIRISPEKIQTTQIITLENKEIAEFLKSYFTADTETKKMLLTPEASITGEWKIQENTLTYTETLEKANYTYLITRLFKANPFVLPVFTNAFQTFFEIGIEEEAKKKALLLNDTGNKNLTDPENPNLFAAPPEKEEGKSPSPSPLR